MECFGLVNFCHKKNAQVQNCCKKPLQKKKMPSYKIAAKSIKKKKRRKKKKKCPGTKLLQKASNMKPMQKKKCFNIQHGFHGCVDMGRSTPTTVFAGAI